MHIPPYGHPDEDPPTWDAYRAASTAVEKHRERADAAEAKFRDAVRLIDSLIDVGDCWFDHHGGCQEHGYLRLELGEKCPQQEAKELVEANKALIDGQAR